MSHIKIKHHKEWKSNDGVKKVIENAPPTPHEKIDELVNSDDFQVAIVTTNDDRILSGFRYPSNSLNVIFEPSPIVTFFSVAQKFTLQAIVQKDKLVADKTFIDQNADTQMQKTSHFLSFASISTLFMFNSIETTLNILIEQNGKPLEYREEIKSVDDILRWASFEDKIKLILPQIYSNNFHSDHGDQFAYIKKLKKLRDSIMHFKTGDDKIAGMRPFILANLQFEFTKTLQAVWDFINYYFPGLIEYCNCGKD